MVGDGQMSNQGGRETYDYLSLTEGFLDCFLARWFEGLGGVSSCMAGLS